MIREFLTFFTAFFLAVAILPRLAGIATRGGLVDEPTKRKTHVKAKPLVGGVGMAMALAVTCVAFVPLSNLRGFYAGFVLLVIVGFLDDFREMKYGGKFLAQILAVLSVVYFSSIKLDSFGDLLGFGPIDFGIFAVPITVFCVVGVINSFNMVDGLDGLAGGIGFVSFLSFAFLAGLNEQPELKLLSLAFAGAVLAFLFYNRLPSKLFMGDAGSLSLGFALAFLSVAVTQKIDSHAPPVAALLILAVPICDTIRVMTARLIMGKSPFVADSKHFHHLLIRLGFNRKRAVIIIVAISSIMSSIAIVGSVLSWPERYMFGVFLFYAFVYTVMTLLVRKILTAKILLKKKDAESVKSGSLASIAIAISRAAGIIRREKRFNVRASVRIKIEERFIESSIYDMSINGFSTFLSAELSIGDKIECEIDLCEFPAIVNLTAEVIWCEKSSENNKYGFKIVKITKAENEFIRAYLHTHDLRK